MKLDFQRVPVAQVLFKNYKYYVYRLYSFSERSHMTDAYDSETWPTPDGCHPANSETLKIHNILKKETKLYEREMRKHVPLSLLLPTLFFFLTNTKM